tara:strand:+ start:588 stop:989 length:402 start_codon:yes stop_codon:yes gene_type:complete
MKITKRQLRRIIKEEKASLLKEQWGNSESSSPLIQFAQAWAGLGGAVQEQVSSVIEAYHNSGGIGDQRFNEAVYDQNPNAIDMAMQRLRPALRLGELGEEGAAILQALGEAQDLFERGDMEAEADARASGDIE